MELNLENRKFINPYIQRMIDYGHWVLPEEQAKSIRGQWASQIFKTEKPVHIEIGTGNGFHFGHYAYSNSQVSLVGFEIKFKTLVQSIARARSLGCTNARMVLGPVKNLTEYFAPGEVAKIIIHFPDPWPKRSHHKNRLMSKDFLTSAFRALEPGGILEFKTDHHEYFLSATRQLRDVPFTVTGYTQDLHKSPWAADNFRTQFESLFLQKRQPICYFSLRKDYA